MSFMPAKQGSEEGKPQRENGQPESPDQQGEPGALLALLRLLTREPSPGHDFKTCPVCKNFGIKKI
jgi:hypothetical protein